MLLQDWKGTEREEKGEEERKRKTNRIAKMKQRKKSHQKRRRENVFTGVATKSIEVSY